MQKMCPTFSRSRLCCGGVTAHECFNEGVLSQHVGGVSALHPHIIYFLPPPPPPPPPQESCILDIATTHTHTTQLPSPAVTSGNPQPSSYTRQAPPSDTNMCGVYVTNVKTPSCLSVQLIGETTTKSLEYLLEDITQFYNSKAGDEYKIVEPHIGQVKSTQAANYV